MLYSSWSQPSRIVTFTKSRIYKEWWIFMLFTMFKSLTNDKLNKNPPKFAIANNFAIGLEDHIETGISL